MSREELPAMNLFGKAKAAPAAADTSSTVLKLRETLDSLDKRCADYFARCCTGQGWRPVSEEHRRELTGHRKNGRSRVGSDSFCSLKLNICRRPGDLMRNNVQQ